MGCSVGVVGVAEVISRDDEVGFGGEMRIADEEDVNRLRFRKSCISFLCWLSPFAFHCAIRIIL